MTTASIVRPAVLADERDLWRLFRAHHAENALFELSERKVQYYLDRVLRPHSIAPGDCGPRGLIGVIGATGALEGAVMLVLGSPWYSDEITMDDCMNFVDPAHRQSGHARTLISYAKHMVDQIRAAHGNFRMIVGVVSTHRTAAKVRLYHQMLGAPLGAYFLYPPALDGKLERGIETALVPPAPAKTKKHRPHRHERRAMKEAG